MSSVSYVGAPYSIIPNDRSSHVQPTPRGGGIAVIAILVITWGHFGVLVPAVAPQLFTVLALAVALGAVSWLDDLRGLNPFLRLAIQAVAVVVGLWTMPGDPIFQGLLPTWAEQTILALCWLWFINLFNFMDGIDGIAGAETAAIGFGIALVAIIATLGPDLALYGVTLAAAALGFLRWNWQPAQIFLGDVGSVPIGFLIGWLLLTLAAEGAWIPALILPALLSRGRHDHARQAIAPARKAVAGTSVSFLSAGGRRAWHACPCRPSHQRNQFRLGRFGRAGREISRNCAGRTIICRGLRRLPVVDVYQAPNSSAWIGATSAAG